ncbi:porin [Candidatus Erwinia haradaeae]|uniref:Outer membrane protein C n=1 Tax=Candidatus Erwinia haradaeae TaxID=1922217 RepID=A0A451DK69_9GAMM|nr:porin [Candidatus Erwinia haradaeae]VFP87129.1 Outer membrane protein C [Candidatus Erwinia haradaeae]
MIHRKILAVMIPALLSSGYVNAAEIYNKDGNKVDLYGTINLKHQCSKNTDDDGDKSHIRLGFRGETQISDLLTGYGQLEYSVQDNMSEKESNSGSQPHVGFAGFKFSDYGTLDYGRNYGVGHDPLAWTNSLPMGRNDSAHANNGMIGRSNDLVTYRNSNLFGLLDGLDFALQYQGKNNTDKTTKDIKTENGRGFGSSISYTTPMGIGVSAAYTSANRTENQKSAYLGLGHDTAETWAAAIKYDANNIYLATMYGETHNNAYIKNQVDTKIVEGVVNKEQKFEAVAQYQFDFGLRPSLSYIQSIGKQITHFNHKELYKYIDVGTYYKFNTNLLTYIDYKINLLEKNNFTSNGNISTDNTIGLGLIYKF